MLGRTQRLGDDWVTIGVLMNVKDGVSGHRARLWARFEAEGLRGGFVHAYEKLEFLLTFAVPRKDTKPLAKALLTRFRSLNGVVTAPPEQLKEVPGVGGRVAGFLRLIHETGLVLDEEYLARCDLLAEPEAVKAYLKRELAWEESEYLIAFYLDGKNRLIRKGRLFRGTLDRVPGYPRELVKEALAANAASVLVAHNHPSGLADPSKADVALTRNLDKALATVGIRLHDHLVVGREMVTSLRERGLFRPSAEE